MTRLRPASYFTLGVSCRCSRPVCQKTRRVAMKFKSHLTANLPSEHWKWLGSAGGQQRVKSDPHTATTDGLMLIHLVYSGLASATTPAFRFCFSR